MLNQLPPPVMVEATAQSSIQTVAIASQNAATVERKSTSYDDLRKVSQELARELVSQDRKAAENMLCKFESQHFARHAEGIERLDKREIVQRCSFDFYKRMIVAMDRMGETEVNRTMLGFALSKDIPEEWSSFAAKRLINRVNNPSIVGANSLTKNLIKLSLETHNPEISNLAARSLGSEKLRGFDSVTSINFYLTGIHKIPDAARKGMLSAIGDMYNELRKPERAAVYEAIRTLRTTNDPNIREVARTARKMGLWMYATAPLDLAIRSVKGIFGY